MLPIQDILQEQTKKGIDLLTKSFAELDAFSKGMDEFFQKYRRDVDEYKKTGKTPVFDRTVGSEDKVAVNIKKEVVSPPKTSGSVLRETQTLKKEPRTTQKVTDSKEHVSPVSIKKEKITNILPHKESMENMPPPPDGFVLKKTIKTENMRSTRTRTRKQKQLEEQCEERKDSDVIIQNPPIVTIDLSTDDDKLEKMVRSTRSKVRAAAAAQNQQTEIPVENSKRTRSPSEESNNSKSCRPKRTKKNKVNRNEASDSEDAITDAAPKNPPPKPATALDVTHIKENSDLKDLLTDDDSPIAADSNKTVVLTKSTKQLFSPYAVSPVKKKVEAFEKLGATTTSGTPMQTRKAAKTNKKPQEGLTKVSTDPTLSDSSKTKSKLHTPLSTNRFIPTHFSTAQSKLKKPSITNMSPHTSYSATKPTIAEVKERELKRQRDVENLQKREALLQAQLEEKRRIRAEKQLKVQQAREAKEQEKKKHLEMMEKLKEEKLKQHLAEKEIKLQKQKEELEKKRQIVKQRAIEEKKLPLYMTTKAPLLPTPDCYDSDAEECNDDKIVFPKWLTGQEYENTLKCQLYMSPELMNTFFCVTPQTIDLTEVFEGIDPRKLKRTSSAVWTKPPRFTFMPGLNNSLDVTKEED